MCNHCKIEKGKSAKDQKVIDFIHGRHKSMVAAKASFPGLVAKVQEIRKLLARRGGLFMYRREDADQDCIICLGPWGFCGDGTKRTPEQIAHYKLLLKDAPERAVLALQELGQRLTRPKNYRILHGENAHGRDESFGGDELFKDLDLCQEEEEEEETEGEETLDHAKIVCSNDEYCSCRECMLSLAEGGVPGTAHYWETSWSLPAAPIVPEVPTWNYGTPVAPAGWVAAAAAAAAQAVEPVAEQRCWHCKKSAHEAELGRLLKCGRCRVAMYCSKKCQKDDWKTGHKKKCAGT